jgi:hypothetical protein
MNAIRRLQVDLVIAAASVIGVAGVIWLAPLMMDQLVFFADREQTRQAAVAREAMIPAAALLLVAAALLLSRRRHLHAMLAALPALVAVPLALAAPDVAYQLLAYAILAPIALGALLSAAAPPPRTVRVPMLLVAAVLLAGLTVLASPITAMVLIGLIVWWRLPTEISSSQGARESAVD